MTTTKDIRDMIRLVEPASTESVDSRVDLLASICFSLCDVVDRLRADLDATQAATLLRPLPTSFGVDSQGAS